MVKKNYLFEFNNTDFDIPTNPCAAKLSCVSSFGDGPTMVSMLPNIQNIAISFQRYNIS